MRKHIKWNQNCLKWMNLWLVTLRQNNCVVQTINSSVKIYVRWDGNISVILLIILEWNRAIFYHLYYFYFNYDILMAFAPTMMEITSFSHWIKHYYTWFYLRTTLCCLGNLLNLFNFGWIDCTRIVYSGI